LCKSSTTVNHESSYVLGSLFREAGASSLQDDNTICQKEKAPPIQMMLEYQELEVLAISTEKPPARREAKSSETTVLHCPKESTICQMMPALTEPVELPTKYTHPQEPAAISLEPPARRGVRSSEPTALHCPKESTICQTMPALTMPMELPPQVPAATSMERPVRREAHSSEQSALRWSMENTTCQMTSKTMMPIELPSK
jgi:hypothetical protein